MGVLYVVEQGAQLGKQAGRLEVRKDNTVLTSVPLNSVSQVILMGGVQVTAAAVTELLDRGIEVAFLTIHGKYKGRLQPALGKNIVLRRAQFRQADAPAFCLEVSRAIARGKLTNQYAACLRWQRDGRAAETFAPEVKRQLEAVAAAQSRDEIMGLEGMGARTYFAALREGLRGALEFPKRTRRPPTDPVSLLLSLAYALLQTQVHAALCLVGFDPFLGFFHGEKYGRPALVLDLMEEFRPLLADAAAVSAVNRRIVQPDDYAEGEGTLLLKEHAVENFVRHFEGRCQGTVAHPTLNQTRTYRQWIEFQARVLAQTVLGELPAYVPFTPAH